jgi:hypothetical protein
MDKESLFFTIFIMWYFSHYGAEIFNTFNRLHNNAINFLELFNLYFEKYNEEDEIEDEIEDETPVKTVVKYEDKFLENIRNMNKEYEFTEEERLEESQKFDELLKKATDERVYQINQICDKISKIELKLTKYESDDNYCIYDDDDDEDSILGETKEERVKNLVKQQIELNAEKKNLEELFQSQKYQEECLITIKDDVRNFIIDKCLNKLENCYVMEFTPQGNVLMKYDKNKESFIFYSDNTIPYRYLEVVGRKYVKQFNCRPIFVDMEEELKLAEEKWENEKEEKEEKEEEEKRKKEEAIKNQTPLEEKKKSVFAKFKSYNKESGTGHVATAAPPKNTIPNKKLTHSQENEKILLKQKANRYTYEGKMANFSFIKKVDRKVVDKKFGMSFADFKKSILKNESNKFNE